MLWRYSVVGVLSFTHHGVMCLIPRGRLFHFSFASRQGFCVGLLVIPAPLIAVCGDTDGSDGSTSPSSTDASGEKREAVGTSTAGGDSPLILFYDASGSMLNDGGQRHTARSCGTDILVLLDPLGEDTPLSDHESPNMFGAFPEGLAKA